MGVGLLVRCLNGRTQVAEQPLCGDLIRPPSGRAGRRLGNVLEDLVGREAGQHERSRSEMEGRKLGQLPGGIHCGAGARADPLPGPLAAPARGGRATGDVLAAFRREAL